MRQLLVILLFCSIPSAGHAQYHEYSESPEFQSLRRLNTDIGEARRRANEDIDERLDLLQQQREQQLFNLRNRLDQQQRVMEFQKQQRLMETQKVQSLERSLDNLRHR